MPALVGPVQIVSIGGGGVVTFGDTFYVSPKDTSKVAYGSGSGNTGNLINTNTGGSATNTFDPDIADQTVAGNG